MNKAVEIEYPPTPIRPFECLRFNLILNKMPIEMSVFPHKSSSGWGVSLMEFSKAAIIIF